MSKIGVVILTWNSDKYISNCLQSLMKLQKNSCDVVVVDNGSQDNTINNVTHIQEQYGSDKIKLIRLKKNEGTTVSRNIGIRQFDHSYEYVCILDSDTVVNEEAFDKMIRILQMDQKNGIAGPMMHDSNGVYQNSGRKIPTLTMKLKKVIPNKRVQKKAQEQEMIINQPGQSATPVGYLMSACWMIKREVIDQVGLLDENIFYAPEDVEYCIRTWLGGYRVLLCTECEIIHEWQRLSRKKLFSKHNWEHIKGLCYMYRKFHFCFRADKIEKYII